MLNAPNKGVFMQRRFETIIIMQEEIVQARPPKCYYYAFPLNPWDKS